MKARWAKKMEKGALVLKQLVRVGHFTIGMVEVYKPLDILSLNRMINHQLLEVQSP